ncbi:MAG: hypothetical protein JXA89_18515 [Anaerolineae bacterium]|nr:hypothetical protein [Anaerolineae bacterium]
MTQDQEAPKPPTVALVVSILLFAGIYLWGFVMGISEMAQKSAPASPGTAD